MKRKNLIALLASLAAIVPITAAYAESGSASICDVDPVASFYSWFAHTFGYCN
jgi:hypothetical protein